MIRTSLVHITFVCATKVAQDRHSLYADTPILLVKSPEKKKKAERLIPILGNGFSTLEFSYSILE